MLDEWGYFESGHMGSEDLLTPNIDRLIGGGVSFLESHSTNPVCSPARSSLLTGRMPVETGVISNNRAIHPSVPNLGQWFSEAGYDTVYCGKWHLPGGYPAAIKGFDVLPVGSGQGDLVDEIVEVVEVNCVLGGVVQRSTVVGHVDARLLDPSQAEVRVVRAHSRVAFR